MKTITKIMHQPNLKNEISRFARFMVVGLSGTLLDFIILYLLKHFLHWPTLPANVVSYSCGIINNYFLNCLWVYPQAKLKQNLIRLFQFSLISLSGLVLNNLLVLILETPVAKFMADPSYAYIPAKIIATGLVLLWNFFANRFWTFGKIVQKQSAG